MFAARSNATFVADGSAANRAASPATAATAPPEIWRVITEPSSGNGGGVAQ
jgi:hypothetical protein